MLTPFRLSTGCDEVLAPNCKINVPDHLPVRDSNGSVIGNAQLVSIQRDDANVEIVLDTVFDDPELWPRTQKSGPSRS